MFEADKFYSQNDPLVIKFFGSPKAQAQLRYRGTYPIYYKIGKRIFLQGLDILEFLKKTRKNSGQW